ncbi:hypothetical protein AArc1_0512 [Natrarchaeobaculum sulfurireducens]|uniref:Uncharacterized protein n=1 Tax=Natrarchaeobaculum sulfurireducens TaxID=2044521 RepID=A0A346PBG1_9EURY|nr:hypothetical protein AArc1_0512 [Natrarchaeobaculum sulfurireducens]
MSLRHDVSGPSYDEVRRLARQCESDGVEKTLSGRVLDRRLPAGCTSLEHFSSGQ